MKNGYNDRNPNLGYAVILLKEAIKLGDVVAMFNLANIYWQNKKSKKAIKLLIMSSLKDFKLSLIFLSILLVKKIDNLTIKTIQDEIKQFGIEISNLDVKLFNIINKLQFKKCLFLDKILSEIQTIDLIYNAAHIPIKFNNSEIKKQQPDKRKNINSIFYEGFGIEIE